MKQNKPCRIDQKRLVTLFKDIKRLKSEETRFCFLIGAGASKSSGIKTGWELAEEWYKSLKDDLTDDELSAWEESIGFDAENVGAFYPHLYQKRYETSPQIGYEEFKKLMEDIEPGIGYVIMSQILSNERHNFVITTNFDYLIEDSVRMYTSKKPFSAGHETLAEFISSQTERPTIIKVHRDLFLHPFNDESDTQKLKEEWKKALRPILRNFNLLVIGYGGNDGSLMDYLESIESHERKAIYWCYRKEEEINDKINSLLKEKDFFVQIKGFDQLMISLNEALDYDVFENLENPDEHDFVVAAKKRINALHSKLKNLLDQLPKENGEVVDEDAKELFSGALKYLFEVYLESDSDKKEQIYQNGMKEYSNDPEFISSYAFFLSETRNEPDKAEELYKKAIELKPEDEDIAGDYALFLEKHSKDHENTQKQYKKAIGINPDHANNTNNYAGFLKNIIQDYDAAEEFYKKAIELNPDNVNIIGNYAIFLYNVRQDYDKAEDTYKKAIEIDPEHANNICNYANFLQKTRRDYSKAKELYQRVIELAPNHVNAVLGYIHVVETIEKDFDKAEELYEEAIESNPNDPSIIGHYAEFLWNERGNYDRAEELYEKTTELDPNNAFTAAGYAILLKKLKKYEKAEEFYKKSIELKPNNASFIGNYATFLKIIGKDLKNVEELYEKAIEMDPEHSNNIGSYALFLSDELKNYKKAEELYQKVLKIDSNNGNVNNKSNYAHHVIVSQGDLEKAGKLIDEVFKEVDKDNIELLVELWFYRYAHYPEWREKAELELTDLISKGAKSLGWNLEPHVEIAKQNGHPNIEKLQEFADAITK